VEMVQVSKARKAAEIGKEDWGAVSQAPPWAVDAWGLGCLMQEAYSGQPLERTESLRNLDDIPKSVAQVWLEGRPEASGNFPARCGHNRCEGLTQSKFAHSEGWGSKLRAAQVPIDEVKSEGQR